MLTIAFGYANVETRAIATATGGLASNSLWRVSGLLPEPGIEGAARGRR
jgi:hypothetical protein